MMSEAGGGRMEAAGVLGAPHISPDPYLDQRAGRGLQVADLVPLILIEGGPLVVDHAVGRERPAVAELDPGEVALLDVVRRTRFGNAKSQTWGTPCFVCRSPRQVD